jgi:hypothetical protein
MSDADFGALWFVLIVAAVLLWLVYDRVRLPKSHCSCRSGRIYSQTSQRWRDHSRCSGTGIRDRSK